MHYLITILFYVYANISMGQSVALKIVYENQDAFNSSKRHPQNAPYIERIGGVIPYKGLIRSSLSLFEETGLYTIDSVYLKSKGEKTKSWIYPTVNLRNYSIGEKCSIYPNIPSDYAYFDECENPIIWKIDKEKTKVILGLKCYYASLLINKDYHQIWFTNDLSYNDGPFKSEKKYGCNLPGLVLEHTMGDGYTTTAIDIKFIEIDKELENKIKKIQYWSKRDRPSYPPSQEALDQWVITVDQNLPEGVWIKLKYISEEMKEWVK